MQVFPETVVVKLAGEHVMTNMAACFERRSALNGICSRRKFTVRMFLLLCLGTLLVGNSPVGVMADNWPQWRGPRGDSTTQETGLPVTWSETENVVWKAALPEWGDSTPAIWGDAIFLTSESDGKLLLVRLSTKDGQIVWTKEVGAAVAVRKEAATGKRSSKFHDLQNLATPSPVTDGERVIVHFGNGLLASYRFDGTLEWRRNLVEDYGPYTIWWGHANSPVLVDNLVISACMQDSLDGETTKLAPSYVVAHDKTTGKVVWHTPRMTGSHAEEGDSYTTPQLRTAQGRRELVVMGGNVLDAYEPLSGERIWSVPGLTGGRTVTGPTLVGDWVFTTVGMRGALQGLKPVGRGQLPGEIIAWKETQNTPDSCSPVAWNSLLWVVTDNGIGACYRQATGEKMWRERIGGRDYKASPLAGDGKVYFLSREGLCTVIAAEAERDVLASNTLDDEFVASPAVSNGRIYLRGKKALYAIGAK